MLALMKSLRQISPKNSRRMKLESVPILRVLARLKQLDCREKGPMSIAERLRISWNRARVLHAILMAVTFLMQ